MTDQQRNIEVEIRTHATPIEAWNAWADPAGIAAWFVDSAEGTARTGETVTWFFQKYFNYAIPYRVLEAVPGERLQLGPPPGGPPFVLDIRITREEGETVVRLVNSGFTMDSRFEEEYQGVVSGWHMAMATLKEYLDHHQGLRRGVALAVHPADVAYADLRSWYTRGDLLSRWLGKTSGIGKPGDEYRIELAGGGTAVGTVLAVTQWEVCLSWREKRGVLSLKAFKQAGQKKLCLTASLWNTGDDELAAAEEWMTGALVRLAGHLAGT